MKKLVAIFLTFMLLFTGCSSQSKEKTEAELKEEIKAELKEEMKAELDAEENQENEESKENSVTQLDLKDTQILKAFIVDNYPESKDDPLDNLTYKYGDFNKDKVEDVVCYFDSRYILDKPVFISQKDGSLYEIESDMEWFQYTQEIEFNDDFIFRITTGGGTGVSAKIKAIYVFDGEKIVHTGADISMEGHESGPNYSSEYMGTITFEKEGDYKNFTNKVIRTGDDASIIEYKYTYDASKFKFDIEEIPSAEKKSDLFYPEDLLEGTKISDKFTIVSFESGDMGEESISYEIKSDDFIESTLFYSSGFIFVKINENAFNKDVHVNMHDFPAGIDTNLNESLDFAVDMQKSTIGEDLLIYLESNPDNKITGECLFGRLLYEMTPMESFTSAHIKEIKISDSELEKISGKELSQEEPEVFLSGFENEILYSEEKPLDMNYSNYSTVIIPMQDTVNAGKLGERTINVTSTGNEAQLKFTVIGKIFGVNLKYTENKLEDPDNFKELYIADTLENEIVTVKVALPSDFSGVSISGSYQYQSGLESFSISLNDMMDPEGFKIIAVDAYGFPEEDY